MITVDFVPLFRGCHFSRTNRIDLQTEGRTPGYCILHELHLLSIPGEEKGAGAFEPLLGEYFLICLECELGVLHAVWPLDFYYVGNPLFAQAEMQLGRRDGLRLHQQAGTQFHFAANAE